MARDFPRVPNQTTKLLQPEENDVIIIGTADSLGKVEHGKLVASRDLVSNYG